MADEKMFTQAFKGLSPEQLEEFYKTVFMSMDTPEAEELRLRYYRERLRHMGEKVHIGVGVRMISPESISIGDNVHIGDNCVLIGGCNKGITIGNGVTIKYGVYLDVERADEGYITIGDHAYIGTGCCLHGHVGLEIGPHTLFAQNITITPYSHIFEDPNATIITQGGHTRKVTIGRDCYIGKNVCILYSADVGDGSVVGSGAVVVKSIPPYSVAVGNPARVIRKRGEPRKSSSDSLQEQDRNHPGRRSSL